MGNTLTDLAPTLFSAAQEVSNEPFALINAINTNFDNKGVAYGDSVTVPVAPVAAVAAFTPAATSTAGTDKIASSVSVAITDSNKTAWHLTGEQVRSLENGNASNYGEWVRQLIAQGMRALRNDMETTAWNYSYIGASRAYGTAGTTPFASDLSDLVGVRKILRDNGAPMSDLKLIINTDAELNLLNLGLINQANVAGSDQERRNGFVGRQYGFQIGASAGVGAHTKGTATGMDCTAIEPIGETTVACDGSDSGTILAGDVIVNTTQNAAGTDTNKYVVTSGSTLTGSATGNFILNRPGVKVATAVADEWTIGANYTGNLAFERNAIVGVVRPPLIPTNPTIQQMVISDEMGMSYLLLQIAQYGQITWELHAAYGFKVVQPEHVAILLG